MKVLLLSDIHGNWTALQAVLAAEPDADQILCLGDLVNYGPQPKECVVWAMQLSSPSRVIQGNHDRAFALGVPQRGIPLYQPLAEAMQSATNSLLTSKMKRFLAKLQPLQEFRWNENSCVACHTVYAHPMSYSFAERDDPAWDSTELSRMDTDMILVGHPDLLFVLLGHPDFVFIGNSHLPMKAKFYGTLVVNPGSVGQPLDADPRAAYAIWQDGTVIFRRAMYDMEETVRAYESLDLDRQIKQQLADGLRTGKWVSTHKAENLAMKGNL
jgi:predicted phosphodiesterase